MCIYRNIYRLYHYTQCTYLYRILPTTTIYKNTCIVTIISQT